MVGPGARPGTGQGSFRGSLARRLAMLVAGAALLAFVLIGALLVAGEHRRLETDAANAAREAVSAIAVPLAQATWDVDRNTLALLLRPLVQRGSIVELRVVDGANVLAAEQRAPGGTPPVVERRWQLPLAAPSEPERKAGVLEVAESYGALHQARWRGLWPRLLAEALTVALVAALVLLLLHRQLTRPLRRLARDVDALGPMAAAAPLALARPGGPHGDELDRLVCAIGALHQRLLTALDERQRAEARERDEASQRALILASVADGVLAFDRKGQPLYANGAAVGLLDIDEHDLKASLKRQAGAETEAWLARFAEVHTESKAKGQVALRRVSHPVRRRDGQQVPAEFIIQALPSGPLGYIVTVRDLGVEASARREAEAALADSRAARAADQAKSQFLSRMSHELRTPMNAVLGMADVLTAGAAGPLAPRQRELLGHLRGAGQHLLALIGDLLDLSRIEAGELALQLRHQPLVPLLEEALALVAPLADAQGVQTVLAVDNTARGASAEVDATRLRQVLLNLLSNAIKYNRRGGRVILGLAADGGSRWALRVEDNGPGMDEAQQARLFSPFDRLGREGSGIEGSGIGLVIARHLVERMGGTLGCRSVAGQGACFTVALAATLPALAALAAGPTQPVPAALADAAPPAAPALQGRVLVVEDDEVNRLLLSLYLGQRPGLEVVLASGWEDAEAAAEATVAASSRFDLVLLDMNLGPHDGVDLRAALHRRWAAAGLELPRWVAFSADPGSDAQRRALASGFDAYWVKPMGLQDFLGALDALMARA